MPNGILDNPALIAKATKEDDLFDLDFRVSVKAGKGTDIHFSSVGSECSCTGTCPSACACTTVSTECGPYC